MSTRTVARQCTLCEAHCGILVTVVNERVTRIEGDPDDVLSHGYICPKATAMGDLHHDPERLRTPLRKVSDGFEHAAELTGCTAPELSTLWHDSSNPNSSVDIIYSPDAENEPSFRLRLNCDGKTLERSVEGRGVLIACGNVPE